MNQGILGGSQMVQGQTVLLALQEERRKQAAEQEMFAAIQQNPALAQQFFGAGPVLGSLQTAPAGTGVAPMTQQTTIPGQPPGAPQVVPGGQDLSQFATQGAPQSTIASLGPQPQGPMQAPRNPVLEMGATNPRAAFLMQQQLQAREDQQFKMQEQRLKMGTAAVEYVGQLAQGVTDQASLDTMRADLVSSGLGKYAAQLPQFYSKGAMESFIAKAVAVKDSLTLQVAERKARADEIRAGLAGRTDAVNTELEIMGLAPAEVSRRAQQGDPQAQTQLAEATNKAEQRQVRIHKAGVTPQVVEGEGNVKYLLDPHTGERRPIPGGPPGTATGSAGGGPAGVTAEPMRGPMTEGQSKTAGYTSRMQTGHDTLSTLEKSGDYTTWKAPLARWPGGRMLLSDKQKEYETAKGVFLTGLLRYDSAGQITETEWTQYGELYFPEPDDPPKLVEFKNKNRAQAIKTHQEMLGRPLPGQQAGGQSGTQAQPTSQGASGGQGAQGAAASGGTATTAWLTQMAKKYNISLDEAKKKAAAAGVKVE